MRLLGMMQSVDPSDLERTEPSHGYLEREQMGDPLFPSRQYPSNAVTEDLRRVTAIPTDHDVVDEGPFAMWWSSPHGPP